MILNSFYMGRGEEMKETSRGSEFKYDILDTL
jgi:hypothetical protein